MANSIRFLPHAPAPTLNARLLAPRTTTTDHLLYRKLLDAVQLLQIRQTAAAHLMVTHVIEILEQSDASRAMLYPIAQRLAADIASGQNKPSIDVHYAVGRAMRDN